MKSTATCAIAMFLHIRWAGENPLQQPERLVFRRGTGATDGATQEFVDEGKIAGVLTMVAREGRIVHVSAVGHRGVNDDRPLPEDALFRIYSMSKPITAVPQ